jgi:ATP-dependent DNA helicase RecQ
MRVDEPAPKREKRHERKTIAAGQLNIAADYDARLFDQLRALRRRLAEQQGVPAFVVFSDATLQAMTAARPTDRQAMLRVSGVGPAKLERYGEAFLAVIRGDVGRVPAKM